jgi:hypothetical protein
LKGKNEEEDQKRDEWIQLIMISGIVDVCEGYVKYQNE